MWVDVDARNSELMRTKTLERIIVSTVLWASAGCGSVLTTVPTIDGAAHESTFIAPRAGSVSVWTLFDGEWIGRPDLRVQVSLLDESGNELSRASCDPVHLHLRLHSFRWSSGERHGGRYEGKMTCSLN